MGIRLSKIRIQNFRSIEGAETELNDTNILIGQNNSGKSNFLRAVNIALNVNPSVSDQDIYISNGEKLSKEKNAIIDVMIRPVDDSGSYLKEFSDFWTGVFTEKWITTDVTEGSYVGIRSIIEYDAKFDQYSVRKRPITQWNDTIEDAICGRKQGFTTDMQSYIECFYMEAHRDILEDLNNKKSFFGRATSVRDIPEDVVHEVEAKLTDANKIIVDRTPSLSATQDKISKVGNLFGQQRNRIAIEPINRSISDLHRGMDVKFGDEEGPLLSVSEQGMGTRSWISFLTLDAYISYLTHSIKEDDEEAELFVVLALEEPEAHLHSYAQKKLFEQIKQFAGQKIISTHSTNVVSQASVIDFLHLYKHKGKTVLHRIDRTEYKAEELAKIEREFIRSKGDLLFSTAVVLSEGITEELALPVYFKQYFGFDPNSAGIAIIGIGGQNYKSFLHILKDFSIPWFIFSDGEPSTIKTIKNAVKEMLDQDYSVMANVIILDNGDDYEKNLVSNGYSPHIINAINKYHKELREQTDPEGAKRDTQSYFESYIKKESRRNKPCSGEEGERKALIKCMKEDNGKAKYAYIIADEIVRNAHDGKKIPPKIIDLLREIEKLFLNGDKNGD